MASKQQVNFRAPQDVLEALQRKADSTEKSKQDVIVDILRCGLGLLPIPNCDQDYGKAIKDLQSRMESIESRL